MTDAARHILNVVCLREDLPLDGWEYYFTAIGDDGVSTFHYDRAPENGTGFLQVRVHGEAIEIDWTQSHRPVLSESR